MRVLRQPLFSILLSSLFFIPLVLTSACDSGTEMNADAKEDESTESGSEDASASSSEKMNGDTESADTQGSDSADASTSNDNGADGPDEGSPEGENSQSDEGEGHVDPCQDLEATGVRIGETPSDFSLPDADGNEHSLYEFCGKVIWLEVGPTWCPYCNMRMPLMSELQDKYSDRGFVAIKIITSDDNFEAPPSPEVLRQYQERFGFNGILVASDHQFFAQFFRRNLPEVSASLLLDSNMVVVEDEKTHDLRINEAKVVELLPPVEE